MIDIIYKKEDWNKVLLEIGKYDFYHTYDYHVALAKKGEIPILIVYWEQEKKIAFPFIKKNVYGKYSDITSVHGYLGPIQCNVDSDFDNAGFKSSFENLLISENIITAFSKLNPFIKGQDEVLNALGNIEAIGELVYFDQQMDDETQKSFYSRNTRRSLKKLRQTATVVERKTPKDIDDFIKIYHQTMDRLGAHKKFYYGNEYFDRLVNSNLFNCKILFAIDDETKETIAAAFATHSCEICHLELICTNEDFSKYGPSRIVYDEARAILKNEQIKYLVLGGGSGGREGSLMKFKSSFTQNYIDYRIWKYIAIPDIYESIQTDFQKSVDSDFFPRYRIV
ncbi:GNAT family N-acetyltransferase [Flagellimonas olearia]|uniref:BioF2-like acetyltransferase domain-containing protein n=1 Tax=Flagellimonas olearia TaxID=552546 RepID=A0A444VKZ0_9FLAO|nr:GNAT family N-acetyltransferase [Allomuricauda olearia]RYC51438.1 hypothetical protein DN53_14675 [Allomuricauda olearia]